MIHVIVIYMCPNISCESISQSCLTLCDPTDRNLLGCSVHRILQARILEWVAIPFSRGSSRHRDQTRVSCGSCIACRYFTNGPPGKPPLHIRYVLSGWGLRVYTSRWKILGHRVCTFSILVETDKWIPKVVSLHPYWTLMSLDISFFPVWGKINIDDSVCISWYFMSLSTSSRFISHLSFYFVKCFFKNIS